jgi:hypothetical protein
MFVPIMLAFAAAAFYFFRTYSIYHKYSRDADSQERVVKRARAVAADSCCLVVFFLATWGPFAISCFLSLIGHPPPLEFDMVSG